MGAPKNCIRFEYGSFHGFYMCIAVQRKNLQNGATLVGLSWFMFLWGQVFTFIAIRHGDVSIQSPMMGVKVIFVAFFSYILKPDEVPALIWIGSILAAAAIFLWVEQA